mmetsp:Transcript_25988/g.56428  ORF Transcript_25988/g.56428 Transcript_25988/m.56428 type:complete len:239 (-) Transcript_25988:397-1113(-)
MDQSMAQPYPSQPPQQQSQGMLSGLSCTRGCGNVRSVCFEPEQTTTTVKWQYVGKDNGGYAKVQTFNYVGSKKGSYAQRTGCGCRVFLVILLSAILVGCIIAPLLSTKGRETLASAWASLTGSGSSGAVGVELFNCQHETLMIPTKLDYCCQKHNTFCNYGSTTGEVALSTAAPATAAPATTAAPITTALRTTAAPATTKQDVKQEYNCYGPEAANWETEWSIAQQVWCCLHHKQGCS